jgi:hypothetical protein
MRKHTGIALTLVVLLVVSVLPAQAWRGYGRHRGLSVAIVPQLVVPVMPYWRLYGYPSVVVAPAPPVYVQPAPQVYVQPPSRRRTGTIAVTPRATIHMSSSALRDGGRSIRRRHYRR